MNIGGLEGAALPVRRLPERPAGKAHRLAVNRYQSIGHTLVQLLSVPAVLPEGRHYRADRRARRTTRSTDEA